MKARARVLRLRQARIRRGATAVRAQCHGFMSTPPQRAGCPHEKPCPRRGLARSPLRYGLRYFKLAREGLGVPYAASIHSRSDRPFVRSAGHGFSAALRVCIQYILVVGCWRYPEILWARAVRVTSPSKLEKQRPMTGCAWFPCLSSPLWHCPCCSA